MQRQILSFIFLLAPIISLAQDDDSPAYKTGYVIGQAIGVIIVLGLIIWAISKLFTKK